MLPLSIFMNNYRRIYDFMYHYKDVYVEGMPMVVMRCDFERTYFLFFSPQHIKKIQHGRNSEVCQFAQVIVSQLTTTSMKHYKFIKNRFPKTMQAEIINKL